MIAHPTADIDSAMRPSIPEAGPMAYLSASRLATWTTCRLKWKLRYIDRLRTKMSPALFFGRAVHRGLELWSLARWHGEPADPESIRTTFLEFWDTSQPEEGINWKGKEEAEREKAWRLVAHYIEQSDIPADEKPVGVEVLIERDFEAAGLPPLRGVIDLVRPGGRIIDYKTAARAPDLSMVGHLNQIQRVAYAILHKEATGQDEESVEFHHLIKTKDPRVIGTVLPPITPQHRRDFVRLMESYVEGIEREDFVPSPGMACSWCDFRSTCAARA